MTDRELANLLKDILEDYRAIQGSPLQNISWVQTGDERKRECVITLGLEDGAVFEVDVHRKL